VPISREMSIALAAGILTDTAWLQVADAAALRRLAIVLEPAALYLEDVLALINSPNRQAVRRSAVLDALRGVRETLIDSQSTSGRWSILAAETDSHDNGFAVTAALGRLGGDVRAVVFPRGNMSMVMVECDGDLVERTGIDLAGLTAGVARSVNGDDAWGTRMWGRVVAPIPPTELLDLCVAVVAQALTAA
jgi:hypothetical protein